MRRFRYALDPVCVSACLLYVLNRGWWRQASGMPFFRNQFDDLLLIPCALPPVLWLQRKFGLRDHDGPPDSGEVGFHLVVWAVIAEGVGPLLLPWAVADYRDLGAYLAGAVGAVLWWHWRGRECSRRS